MGVEYKHFIIPADPTFIPKNDIISKIDNLLAKWNLRAGDPIIFDLTNGENIQTVQDLNLLQFGHGLALEYPGIEGKQVREIIGASYYDEIVDDERYLEKITLIVGSDYRVHPSNEELYLSVTKPPSEKAVLIKPYCEVDEFLHYGLHAEAYHCSINTSPPIIKVSVTDRDRIIGDQNFLGFWRTAFIIDLGKDLPKIGDILFKLENDRFIDDVEQAFESKMIQIGEVY